MPEIRFYTLMTVGWTAFVVTVIILALIFAPSNISDEFPSRAVQPPEAPRPPSSGVSGFIPSEPEAHRAEEEEGHDVFVAKGCSACHGQDGEGTSIAPALAGHNEQMVRRQVRTPRFQMPAFTQAQINEEELQAIVRYISTLEGTGHQHAERSPTELIASLEMHHWMSLEALKSASTEEAVHHVGHIIELLDEGNHRQRMEDVLVNLQAGETHDAEHDIEEMVAGTAVPGLTLTELHLRQALVSLAVENMADAQHHITHFQKTANPEQLEHGAEVLDLLERGDLHDAEREIQELLGEEEHED